ncbi:MAG TPA: DNA polymerase III subunit beta [Nitrospira sp.]|nr:DNA polymerase III subunit beta [Nitrospira sp.]
MKIELDRTTLTKTLKLMHSVLDRNPKMAVLKYLLVTATPTGLTLAATDLELGLQRTLDVTVGVSESLLMPSDPLVDFLRELTTETIQLTTDSQHAITISAGKAKAKFKGLDPKEYPALPSLPEPWLCSLPPADLDQLLAETLPAVGEADARYILNSIQLQFGGDPEASVEAVGADGHRLVVTKRTTGIWLTKDHRPRTVLMPKKAGKVLRLLLADTEEEQMAFSASSSLAAFRLGPYRLTSRLMEGNYPLYEKVIPAKPAIRFTVPKLAFEDPLRRVSVISGRDAKPITLAIEENRVVLKAVNVDLGEATEAIDTQTFTKEQFLAGFNTHYLLDALETMPGEQCDVHMDTPISPCVLTTPEQKDWRHVIMPVRV